MTMIIVGQVAVMFMLILVGVICAKTGIYTEEATGAGISLVLLVVSPAVILREFTRPGNTMSVADVFIAMGIVVVLNLVSTGLATLLIRKREGTNYSVERVAAAASNAGFMGLPLISATVGEHAVFYGTIFIAVFQIFTWTFWIKEMGGESYKLEPMRLVKNVALIGVVISFILFSLSVELPPLVVDLLDHLTPLNTTLPMIIMGVFLAGLSPKELIPDRHALWAILLRGLIIPLVIVGLMWVFGVTGWTDDGYTMTMSIFIGSATPAAVATILLSKRTGRPNPRYGAGIVAVSTALSILTIPLVVGIAEIIL